MWVLRLWLEQNLEVSVPLLISKEKNVTPDSTYTICKSGDRKKGRGLETNQLPAAWGGALAIQTSCSEVSGLEEEDFEQLRYVFFRYSSGTAA